jgi:uncharacterized protein
MSRTHQLMSWLDPRAQIRHSTVEGRGIFASAPIAVGDTVMVLGGAIIDDVQLAEQRPHSSLAIAEGVNLVQDNDDPSQFGNHSCDPNLWMLDEVAIVARRNIAEGEELTIDYALMTVAPWHMECHCGVPTCRGTITGNDWRLPDLRSRYQGHFSPFINERIRRDAASPQCAG